MTTLYRFTFCPASHNHATPQDAANCPELVAAFGELRKARREKRNQRCSELGCISMREHNRRYCRFHRAMNYRSDRARREQW